MFHSYPYNIARIILNKHSSSDTKDNNTYTRAAKTLREWLKKEKVPEHLAWIGELLKTGINNLAKNYGLDEYVKCLGYPCRTILSFTGNGYFDGLEMKSFFQQELIRRGILWAAYHALSWSHSESDINRTLHAFDETMLLFKKIINKKQSLRSMIEGEPVKPVFRKVADFNSYTAKIKP